VAYLASWPPGNPWASTWHGTSQRPPTSPLFCRRPIEAVRRKKAKVSKRGAPPNDLSGWWIYATIYGARAKTAGTKKDRGRCKARGVRGGRTNRFGDRPIDLGCHRSGRFGCTTRIQGVQKNIYKYFSEYLYFIYILFTFYLHFIYISFIFYLHFIYISFT
jgi:hypothetical protein